MGGGWLKWMMGTNENTCDEHRVLYVSDESLNSPPKLVFHCVITECNLNENLRKKKNKSKCFLERWFPELTTTLSSYIFMFEKYKSILLKMAN